MFSGYDFTRKLKCRTIFVLLLSIGLLTSPNYNKLSNWSCDKVDIWSHNFITILTNEPSFFFSANSICKLWHLNYSNIQSFFKTEFLWGHKISQCLLILGHSVYLIMDTPRLTTNSIKLCIKTVMSKYFLKYICTANISCDINDHYLISPPWHHINVILIYCIHSCKLYNVQYDEYSIIMNIQYHEYSVFNIISFLYSVGHNKNIAYVSVFIRKLIPTYKQHVFLWESSFQLINKLQFIFQI